MQDTKAKPFSWSFSRLKGFEVCPKRYYETQVKKDAWPEPRSSQLQWGEDAHAALATALKTNTPLPTLFKLFQPWVDKVARTPGELLVEEDCRWAMTREFQPTPWFAKNVWLRTVADAVKLDNDAALVVDWKAGKSENADPIQLVLTSLMMFCHFPELQVVRSDFIWLNEGDNTTQVLYRNEAPNYWSELIPRVQAMQQATLDNHFPPTPNRFCRRYCPVKSCEHWGKG